MKKSLLIFGGGGHGRVVADLAYVLGHKVAGYVDRDPTKIGEIVEPRGGKVLYGEEEFLCLRGLPEGIDALALAIGDNASRLTCLEELRGLPIPPLVHPAATVSPSAEVGRGTVVFAGAVVNAAARLGDAVIVNSGAIVEHDCVLEDGVHVSPGAVVCGGVHLGRGTWVGAGATVIQYLEVGADVVVGAGAVVHRNVPSGETVVGVPCHSISRNDG